MSRKVLLAVILAVLAYGLWISANLKEVSAGVAIFLVGMYALERGFRAFTGGVLEKVLRHATDRLWKSLGFGIATTTLMQSSSLVSVLTISFLSAGLLGLYEGIGIIFGANLGTTTGAWLVAAFGLKVNLSTYAMPMLVFGVILGFQRSRRLRGGGFLLAGIGFLFLGIHYMKEGFEAFRVGFDLAAYSVEGIPGLLLFSLIGLAATVVMQSSHATLVLIITALAAGQISYDNALALAIGANVGTTVTALIGAAGANEQGRRLAGAHLVFNAVTGLVAMLFIGQFVFAVERISEIVGIGPEDHTLKLAVFHTLFNLVGIVIMTPFMRRLVRLLNRLVPDRLPSVSEPRYIVSTTVEFPDTAMEAVRNETLHIYDNAIDIITRGLCMDRDGILVARDPRAVLESQTEFARQDMDELYEGKVKRIFSAVIEFISKAEFTWAEWQSGELHWLRDANRNIVEAVKAAKHLQKNMIRYLGSDNAHARDEYNGLRLRVANLLRSIDRIRRSDHPDEDILSLDEVRLTIQERDREQTRRLYRLIHEGRITPTLGTSLMNDCGYTADIERCLTAMAVTLFASRDRERGQAERSLSLDAAEIENVLDSGGKGS